MPQHATEASGTATLDQLPAQWSVVPLHHCQHSHASPILGKPLFSHRHYLRKAIEQIHIIYYELSGVVVRQVMFQGPI
ncbi:hypothetical protein E2C01_097261 [Portunus trituberculatus]|uniref:Uncharacterized protein n=1 Tax=Portunus trituberculatus TaxID=210409 RepID=A0A5B7JXV7_PORTR|nr:hypothetical protein [Portunus trituberculatus]